MSVGAGTTRQEATVKEVVLILAVYWTTLLLVALLPSELLPRSLALVTLIAGGLPLGVIAGIALYRSATSRAGRLAYYDELTGLRNRRSFTSDLHAALQNRVPGTLALLLIDVDGLKLLNDGCGHLSGDELLETVGHDLDALRGRAYRLSGDEFAIIVDRDQGDNLTANLRDLVAHEHEFKACGHTHRIGISYGYASNRQEDGSDSLSARADLRLREHKQVVHATRASELIAAAAAVEADLGESPSGIASIEAKRRQRASGS